jgi:hypothetical protein
MRRRGGLRMLIGLSLVATHFLAIAYILMLTLRYLRFDDALDLVLILAPLFSMFTLAVVRHAVTTQEAAEDETRLSAMFCIISIGITFFFIFAIFALITALPLKLITSVDGLKKGVGVCEVLIATYMGLIVETLFGRSSPAPRVGRGNG